MIPSKKPSSDVPQVTIAIILESVLIMMWAFTTSSKLYDYMLFMKQIALQPLIPLFKILTQYLLIPTEICTALLLVFPSTRLLGLKLSILLLTVFTFYILWLYQTQPHLPCACGGPISGLKWWQHLLFNGSFLLMASVALLLEHKGRRLLPFPNQKYPSNGPILISTHFKQKTK